MKLLASITAFLSIVTPISVLASSCNSQYYCIKQELKYITMAPTRNASLNATAIRIHIVENVASCQKFCTLEERCKSINMRRKHGNTYECQLLALNKFSHSHLMVSDEAFTHFYIPSKCEGKPCKNGGVCITSYGNDSFKCDCKSSNILIASGNHCEDLLTGYKTALAYYSFDNLTQKEPWTKTGQFMKSHPLKWDGFSEPGRKSPVVSCKGSDGACMETSTLPCFSNFAGCGAKVTYTIWLRYRSAQAGKKAIIFSKYHKEHIGCSFISDQNGYKFSASISATKRWNMAQFGKNVKQTKWNQFTFTIDDSSSACVYINGVKEECQTSYTPASYTLTGSNAIRIGGDWYARAEPSLYLDDFAVWNVVLTDEEIMQLYKESKD